MHKFLLKDNFNGKPAAETAVELSLKNGILTVRFDAHDGDIYCPYNEDNADLYEGDVCEIFFSPDGDISKYYEIEVSPHGNVFYATVDNAGGTGERINIEKLSASFSHSAEITGYGYKAEIVINLNACPGYDKKKCLFNIFRIDAGQGRGAMLYALNPTFCGTFHKAEAFLQLSKIIGV